MNKLTSCVLIVTFTIHSSITYPIWQETKDFLKSKPMIFVYGAALGGGAVKFFIKDLLLRQIDQHKDDQLITSRLVQGEKIHKAVMNRKNGLVDYLQDSAIRTNELLAFVDHGTTFKLYRYASNHLEEATKALEKIKNNLELYNEYLLSIGEPEFYFEYQNYRNDPSEKLDAIIFQAPAIKKEVLEIPKPKENEALLKIQHGEKVAQAINARKEGLLGYLKDMAIRTADVRLDIAKQEYVWCFGRKIADSTVSWDKKMIISDANDLALDTLKKNLEAYNAYLESRGELQYHFCYKLDVYNRLIEIYFKQ